MTDEELKKLNLPEVPDEFLDRWLELVFPKWTPPKEALNGNPDPKEVSHLP